ncbi:hypothetical protein MKX03_023667 [Papaver bracteatum]|nr:hypothetical protein MKX03_023667 [Papaver bracteatum]
MPSPSLQFFDQPKSSASQSNQSVNVRIQLSDNRDSGIPIARKRSQSNCPVEPKHLFKLDETAGLTKGSHQDTKAEEVKEENTISYIHDEVGQIRHEVILSSELTHTSLCYTYLAMVQRDDKLEKQGTVRKKGHYEVESTLDDVQVGMELSGKQLPLHGGFPDRFQMITFQKSKKMAEIQRW